MENKVFAVKKQGKFWSAIDCGETKTGGMTYGTFWNNHFKKDGRTYRWYAELFMPPSDLVEWHEIKTLDKMFTVVVEKEGNAFDGWEDKEDGCFVPLQNFAKLLGKNLTTQEVKELIDSRGR